MSGSSKSGSGASGQDRPAVDEGFADRLVGSAQHMELPSDASITLREFADSLYHGERANNAFKFLRHATEDEFDQFLQQLLEQVAAAADTGDSGPLADFFQQAQARGYNSSAEAKVIQSAVAPGTSGEQPLEPIPLAPLRVPLSQARIALFTSAALRTPEQPSFVPPQMSYEELVQSPLKAYERHPSLREIPMTVKTDSLLVEHPAYDIAAASADPNVVLPIDRLRELAADGVVGLSENSYSYSGNSNIPRLIEQTAPDWAEMLRERGVDAVVLTPGCPVCHVSVCHVARAFEMQGIPTAMVFTEAWESAARLVRPPRIVLTRFPLGRPFGPPSRPAIQRQVLLEALQMLESATPSEWMAWHQTPWSSALRDGGKI